ncbi:dirigent protein 1 [Lolium perenne]|jgi:hypothetical protein|uniref:dirigent protein 1 n=1 Tax=Lolium perenne TaxID=4522 RepID=UPI0021F5A198|nr:dirigent protein 1-like [Lolium perenne]
MAFTTMAPTSRILFLVSLTLALATAPAAARSKQIHLHFYMHDITGGPGQTAVQLVKSPGPAHPSPYMPGAHFGDTTVIDDALTEGPDAASRAVGRAQGSYMLAGLKEPALMVSMNVALTGGAYNGSTIAVVGRDDVSAAVRELAVTGGTGAFRKATGHVLWRTAKVESRDHIVLELDVYATVPGAAAASDGQRQAGVMNTTE